MSVTPMPIPPGEPAPGEIAAVLAAAEQYTADAVPRPAPVPVPAAVPPADPDGYTARVTQREALVAEADRLRDLPTDAMLAREAALAEERGLAALETRALVGRLHDQGERERAVLSARAESAAARRAKDTDPHVRALDLTRQRAARVGMLWTVLGLALAYTAVNVQKFAAGGATATDPRWWVAWGVDPVLSALVVALLLAKGDLAGVRLSETRWTRWSVWGVEIGALLAQLLMNVSPTIGDAWQVVALHVVIPLAAVAAAIAIPITQRRYAAAIADLTATVLTGLTDGLTGGEYRANPPTLTDLTAGLVTRARELIAAGELSPDPSANALRGALRVGTDTARAVRDELRHRP